MSKDEKKVNEKFEKYMDYIINHPNYEGLPGKYKEDGSIKWVASGNSKLGQERAKWWDNKIEELGVSNRAEVARLIHPKELNGMKPCQICGKELNINYVYPNKNTLKKINKNSNSNFKSYDLTISEIFDKLYEEINGDVYELFRLIFNVPIDIENDKSNFIDYILNYSQNKLSPGVMSNAPDRFDGFHSYNACCRSKEDKGRHKSNLARYSQDRRAYENWAEGNWNLANRLMGEFNKYDKKVKCPNCGKISKMTADHIGPISLGFTHRPKFNPLCDSCNSGKNNKMSYNDIKTLLHDEKQGDKVISWHTKYLWDNLKMLVKNDNDALKLSKIMRKHIHNILSLLNIIYKNDFCIFLKKNFLHPEYSFYDYKFEDFDPLNLQELKIIETPLNSKNKIKNAKRYVRISFESLEDYSDKNNRKLNDNLKNKYNEEIKLLLDSLKNENNNKSLDLLNRIIIDISDDEIDEFKK